MILEEIKKLDEEWQCLLESYLASTSGKQNIMRLDKLLSGVSYHPCIPKAFRPLHCLKPSDIKVVIVGQDPYPDKEKATGFAFSYPNGVRPTNSIKNIFRAMVNDGQGSMPQCGNLDYLSNQGVLLMNRIFTYAETAEYPDNDENDIEEMKRRWRIFSRVIIAGLGNAKSNPKVFLLWGSDAQQVSSPIDRPTHTVLESAHPSPANPQVHCFLNCKHFSKTNDFLKENGHEEINWIK